MTLKQSLDFNSAMLPVSPRAIVRSRLNSDNSRGRGRNAKRRAGDLAQAMLWSNEFGPQFDRLNRYSHGLNSTTY